MYYIYHSFESTKLTYIHLFEGEDIDDDGYVTIIKSLFRFGRAGVYMTPVGDKLFIKGRPSSEEIANLVKMLILAIFENPLNEEGIIKWTDL